MGRVSKPKAAGQAALRREILKLVARYAALRHTPEKFVPGVSPVPVSGRVFGAEDVQTLTDSALDFWLTTGRFNAEFETKLGKFLGDSKVITVNSGSSANLLAVAALTAQELGDRALRPGDEIIGTAACFPTTVNPQLLYGLVPVFLDVDIPTYNMDISRLEEAITPRTKAIMAAHTLGNPFNLAVATEVARRHGLWLIEDCCDALGSTYQGRSVGTFGDMATLSFYPAHQITMGEGGAVFTSSARLAKLAESFRDWGRDCWCAPGKENTCGKRFGWKLGELPHGYDHKYAYSHLGYNLKITDMQAAVGVAQLKRLPSFTAARRLNFSRLKERLARHDKFFILPQATLGSEPSWFGFPLTMREDAPFTRAELIAHLQARKVATRLLFAGNITRQPYFKGRTFRAVGDLTNTDVVMSRTFWLGVYPGLSEPMIDYAAAVVAEFIAKH